MKSSTTRWQPTITLRLPPAWMRRTPRNARRNPVPFRTPAAADFAARFAQLPALVSPPPFVCFCADGLQRVDQRRA
ncbi:MAG: hypothetical protein FJ086_16615 [Deltaproteobacteria bacterium]|nr:hypothetical protein [Deltaproteobacteria bacterium]